MNPTILYNRVLPTVLMTALLVLLAWTATADTTFVAGVGGGNGACGEFQPEGFVEFDHDDADIAGALRRSCGA